MEDMTVDNTMETIRPPVRGILTQKLSKVRWYIGSFPLGFEDRSINDVAFIGDTFVEIRRLGVGPHLYEIIRKDDFGSRIRNASVLGSLEDYEKEQVRIKEEPEDVDMINTSAPPEDSSSSTITLPPQILVLQLEAGTSSDSVFLMLHQSNDGSWKFISSRRRLSKAMDKLQPGMHLAIDPSSRYMVIGCSEQCFTIQVFHTRMELNRQYANGEELRFVESERVILCKGAILKLEFLNPPDGSDDDIILLLIVATNGKIRMLLYAWKAGDHLSTVKTQSFLKKGYPLNDIPLLIIPLRFEAAFIFASGGTYLNTARKQPNVKKDTQNWSPAMDLVVIKNNSKSKLNIDTRPQSFVPIPDSIFVCSGKGAQSSITELRSGIEAILGLDLEFHSALRKAWILPSEVYSDLKSRTIVACVSGNRAIQVTEQSIIILDSGKCTVLNDLNMMGFPQASSLSACFINDAVICDEKVLFTTHHKEKRMLRILETLSDDEVTCIAMYMHPQYPSELVIAGQRKDGEISLVLITENEFHSIVPLVDIEGCSYDLRALSSIILKPSSTSDNFTLLCGTLTGLVISLDIVTSEGRFYIRDSRCDRFGGSVATLTNGDQLGQSNFFIIQSTSTCKNGAKRKTVPRRIHIRGTPYRIIYSETRNAFVVGASVDGRSTIYFVDPKTGENLSDPRDGKHGAQTAFVAGLGRFDDKILCIYEWLYSHDAYTWNFLVVCTSDGRVLIICTKNDDSSVMPCGRAKISFWTVTQFKNFDSVYAVVGDSEGLYYCAQSGSEFKLYYSMLNKDDKKFNKNPAEAKLLSPAISLFYDSGKIYALTRHHSLQILEVIKTNGQIQLRHTHTDQLQRQSLHHLQRKPSTSGPLGNSQIELVSDRSRSVTGLCAISGLKVDTLDTIFEAQLPASVLRLRSANCRPVWDCSWMVHKDGTQILGDLPAHLGIIHNDETNSETLGLGIDGSLYHFTMLDIRAWRFLRFLANLARSSGLVGGCPWEGCTDLEPEQDPRNMQVDGDILKRVVENRRLEELFRIGEHQTDENKREFKRFCDLLEMIHDEKLENDEDPMFYIELAYEDLEVFLRPVI
ncbi:hypothetical protein EYC84_005433 [Monilinia fructicola]|uniref:RSE1/DDB1/CPSF1 first beta-propeller domain-containing protein n=1 Tax=Monilinia fructicola TaxID=38448 RepID=A0A5M9JWG0_MONFR|nr:hypothetical protein EYC84_005433 [Monilinia fructicola]